MSAQGLGALAAALRGGFPGFLGVTRTVIQYDTACWLCGLVEVNEHSTRQRHHTASKRLVGRLFATWQSIRILLWV
jgi:hypothetical protein